MIEDGMDPEDEIVTEEAIDVHLAHTTIAVAHATIDLDHALIHHVDIK